MKSKEELEQAANKHADDNNGDDLCVRDFIAGANWQSR